MTKKKHSNCCWKANQLTASNDALWKSIIWAEWKENRRESALLICCIIGYIGCLKTSTPVGSLLTTRHCCPQTHKSPDSSSLAFPSICISEKCDCVTTDDWTWFHWLVKLLGCNLIGSRMLWCVQSWKRLNFWWKQRSWRNAHNPQFIPAAGDVVSSKSSDANVWIQRNLEESRSINQSINLHIAHLN